MSKRRFRRDQHQHRSLGPTPLGDLLGFLREPGAIRKPVTAAPEPCGEWLQSVREANAARKTARERARIADEVWRERGVAADLPTREGCSGVPVHYKGEWLARAGTEDVQVGDRIRVYPKTAAPWDAEVTEVVWKGNGRALVRTGSPGVAAGAEVRQRTRSVGFSG